MTDLILVLSRSPEQQSAFDTFVASQYDSTSSNYHHWLQPEEVGEKFGPSLADIATLSGWLASHGFSIAEVSKDRMSIRFGGSVAQVENAFHTEIHNLSLHSEMHIANTSDPQIPASLAPVVFGVKALHDFRPKPQYKLGGMAQLNKDTGVWQRAAITTPSGRANAYLNAKALPQFGITSGTGASAFQIEDVAPYDFATIYNVLPLWTASPAINGTGQTIAVTGTSDINPADISTFRSAFGLPAGLAPQQVKGANGLDPGICTSTNPTATCTVSDLIENTLDVEWSGAVAPGAQIVIVTSGLTSSTDDTVYDSSSYVVENIGVSSSPVANAHILNVSYGACELGEGTGGNAAYSNLWQTAAAEGIAVFVASGDAGSAACDQGLDGTVPYEATYGLSVSGLASTPYNTAVGGTDLNWGSKAAPYWNATNNATNGASAVGYVPEVPWNDTCTNPATLTFLQQQIVPALASRGYTVANPTDAESSCQFIVQWYSTVASVFSVDISGFVDVVGAGGGASTCTTSDGANVSSCTGGYQKPSWQAGVSGLPTDGKRDLPDVSLFASNGFLGSASLICVSEVGSCTYSSTTENTAQEVGGTSVASPAMAGVMAMINQKAGAPQGSPNAELYALAAKQTYTSCVAETVKSGSSCYFNDIDTATIAMPCQPSTPNCTATHSSDSVAVLSGFAATPGYDQATGLGSLNVANVVNAWPAATTSTGTATVTVTPSSTSISVLQGLTVTITVTGSGAAPTGTITLVGPGFAGGVQTLASGGNTFTIPAYGAEGGNDTLTATYSGDTNYATATGTANLTVSKLASSSAVTAASSGLDTGQSLSVTATITGSGIAPTGTVTFSSGSYSSGPQPLFGGAVTFSIQGNSLAAGSDTITASYSGDANYIASSATTSATLTQSTYALAASAPAAVKPGSSTTSTITVSTSSGYSGSVALTCKVTTPPAGATDLPTCVAATSVALISGATSATGTLTVSTTAAITGALAKPALPGTRKGLADAAGAVLALLVFLGVPARRRSWRTMVGMLALLVALGSLAACGGGGGGGGGTSNPGTTAGSYTLTVTGTGSDPAQTTASATFMVTVN